MLDEADLNALDMFALALDQRRTIRSKGKRFFFVKTTFAEKAKVFKTPKVTVVSYPAGTDVPVGWQ